MDPTACHAEMIDPTTDADEKRERARDLIQWLDGGGFAPKGTTPEDARRRALAVLNPKPKRTELDRTVETVYTLKQAISGIFRAAERNHYTHSQILQQRQAYVFNGPRYNRLPQWARAELKGYFEGWYDRHWTLTRWQLFYDGAPVDSLTQTMLQSGLASGAHVYAANPSVDYTERQPIN